MTQTTTVTCDVCEGETDESNAVTLIATSKDFGEKRFDLCSDDFETLLDESDALKELVFSDD